MTLGMVLIVLVQYIQLIAYDNNIEPVGITTWTGTALWAGTNTNSDTNTDIHIAIIAGVSIASILFGVALSTGQSLAHT